MVGMVAPDHEASGSLAWRGEKVLRGEVAQPSSNPVPTPSVSGEGIAIVVV